MEKGHTKFSPDTGFGLVRREEKNSNLETMNNVVKMVSCSTPHSNRNRAVHFEPRFFKVWNHHERSIPIPNIRKQHLIQFAKDENGYVLTRSKQGYTGSWTEHGYMLKRGQIWFDYLEEDLIDVPPSKLKLSRILHIRRQICR